MQPEEVLKRRIEYPPQDFDLNGIWVRGNGAEATIAVNGRNTCKMFRERCAQLQCILDPHRPIPAHVNIKRLPVPRCHDREWIVVGHPPEETFESTK